MRTRWGELDLVFVQGKTLVVVEVKTGSAGERFTPGVRLGAEALARRWIAARALARDGAHRVDLIEVRLDAERRTRLVHHVGIRRSP